MSMFFHVEKMKVEQEKDEEKVKELNDKKGSEPNPIKAQTQEPASSTPPLVSPQKKPSKSEKDADTRFISSFRGRTIHGLSMDIPTGYTGLLLHGDPQPTTVSHVDRVLHHPNDSVDDNDLEMDEQEIPPLRKLIPQSTFSSITLWHADRAVDEIQDEYYRTLTEWMALSHEVCKMVYLDSNE